MVAAVSGGCSDVARVRTNTIVAATTRACASVEAASDSPVRRRRGRSMRSASDATSRLAADPAAFRESSPPSRRRSRSRFTRDTGNRSRRSTRRIHGATRLDCFVAKRLLAMTVSSVGDQRPCT
jgi:hypothetical protein